MGNRKKYKVFFLNTLGLDHQGMREIGKTWKVPTGL
jgi:hypothetical protein